LHLLWQLATILLMNPNQGPIGPEFKEEALNAKFSYSFTRKQLIILVNALRPLQIPLGDIRNGVLLEILGEIERTAIQSITNNDYKKPEPPPTQPLPEAPKVETN
jgi:hypothetical protein